jgi:flagellar motor switch protein FliN/FliY
MKGENGMSDSLMSQEEIDALLKASSKHNEESEQSDPNKLSPFEIDVLGEIGNISMGTSATTLNTLLGNKITITTPKVSIVTWDELKQTYSVPYVGVLVEYIKGVTGFNMLILNVRDVMIITDLMTGGDGINVEGTIGDMQLSAVSEAMNQMIGSASTSLATILKKDINISPPKAFMVDFPSDIPGDIPLPHDKLVQISFDMVVGDLINSNIMQLMPIEFAKDLVNGLTASASDSNNKKDEAVKSKETIEPQKAETTKTKPKIVESQIDESKNKVEVKPAVFRDLDETPADSNTNINIIMDVPLEMTVELGRAKKTIKEILEMGSGSVVELDKIAGEPVDILVNGKVIAKGEVVVIDENFGVRVLDIVNSNKNKSENSFNDMED